MSGNSLVASHTPDHFPSFTSRNMIEPRVPVPYVRLCFSYETEDNMWEAMRRLGEALRLHQDRGKPSGEAAQDA